MILRLISAALALSLLLCGQQQKITRNEPLVVKQDGRYGYIDHQGNILIKPRFYWGGEFSDGLASVYVCGRVVSIDASGNIRPHRITPAGTLVPRQKETKVGFIDAAGHFKIAPTFDDALPFSEGLAAVKVGEKWGFVDIAGHQVIEPRFEGAYYFYEGVAIAEIGGGKVLIDRKGKVLISGFDLQDIAEGRVLVLVGRNLGFIDFKGKVTVPPIYESAIGGFQHGVVGISKAGKWGFVDRDGRVSIPFQFSEVGEFLGGRLAPAKTEGLMGFIDRSGKFKFLLPYESSPGFTDGDVARFWTEDQRFGYVHESGKVIWGPTSEDPLEERVSIQIAGVERPPEWSPEEKTKSCADIPESIRRVVASFPPTVE